MAVARAASVLLCLLVWDMAQPATATPESNILRQLMTHRPNASLGVSILGLGGSKLNIYIGQDGHQRRTAMADVRAYGADLRVWGHTLIGSCSTVAQKVVRWGGKSIPVQSCGPFKSSNRVMIHQTQGTKDTAGTYQMAEVRSCNKRSLFLRQPLLHTFYSGSFGGSSPKVTQVVPVMQARNINICHGGRIEAPRWNGKCGGIIALRASRNIRVCEDSVITATGAGFRGAPQYISHRDYVYGFIGESERVGYAVRRQKRGVGLGGGSGNGNAGGAGGAHKTVGSAPTSGGCSRGGPGTRPSRGVSSGGSTRLYFGGSGGASGSHSVRPQTGRFGAKGGRSGGIISLQAGSWIKASSKSIQAEGLPGQNGYLIPTKYQAMGGGGGGAGGTVVYKQASKKRSFTATVKGGAGGSLYLHRGSCNNSGRGGSGGVGEVVRRV